MVKEYCVKNIQHLQNKATNDKGTCKYDVVRHSGTYHRSCTITYILSFGNLSFAVSNAFEDGFNNFLVELQCYILGTCIYHWATIAQARNECVLYVRPEKKKKINENVSGNYVSRWLP